MKLKKVKIFLPLAAITILALPLLMIHSRSAYADYNSCVSSSGAPNVESVQNACSLYGGGHRGAAWINSKDSKEESTVYAADWDTTTNINLWGQVYGPGPSTTYYAVKVMLLSDGTYSSDNGQPYSFTPGNTLSGISVGSAFSRGSISASVGWSGGGSVGGTLTPRTFFDNPAAQCTTGSNGDQICRKDVHVYRCFSTTSDGSGVNQAEGAKPCYSDASHVQMLLHDTNSGDSSSYFESQSKVSIAAQGSDISAHELTTDIDKTGDTIRFSTDETDVNIDFTHWLYYHNLQAMRSVDTYDPAETPWKIQQQVIKCNKTSCNTSGTWKNLDPAIGGDWQPGGQDAISDKTKEVASNYRAHFDSGKNRDGEVPQYVKVCQRIVYDEKYFKYKSADRENGSGGYVYDLTKSGNGKSSVCVRIDYVGGGDDDPLLKREGDVQLSASAGSNVVMLAGETANLSITGKARGIKTRRLIGKRAGVFDYSAATSYNNKLNESDPRYNNARLCPKFLAFSPRPNNCYDLKFYSADYNVSDSENPSPDGTEVSSEGSYGDNNEKDAGGAANVAVPDDVGGKYCNAFGWKFRYYYMIKKNGVEKWYKEPSKDYFFVPTPACRTIAKKPTTAFWNGSVLVANDSIVMSLAKRNLVNGSGPKFGDMWTNEGFQHANGTPVTDHVQNLYGSWSEYLAASRDNMEKKSAIASGSSISTGAKLESTLDVICNSTTEPWSTNSSLTISNVGCNLDGAQANLSSSAFRTRLTAYLENASGSAKEGANIIDATDQSVYKISSNIVNANDDVPYSIRTLPQTIIFANDVEISGIVTRIDAWIIAKGKVNTCTDYVWGTNYSRGTEVGIGTKSDGVGAPGGNCANQLVFNGPVVAGKLELNRTFGADSQAQVTSGISTNGNSGYSMRESSAEIFNLRADAYLWSYAQAARYGSSYNEVYSRELAPRY